jgi:cytochrome c oxidase subunit 4
MSTTVDPTHAHDPEAPDHGHSHTAYYVKVAAFLAVITAVETSTYWVDFGPLFMPVLLILMAVKFFMVVLVFMHLKDDAKVFSWLFYAGLGLAVGVYVAALLTFEFFG